LIVDFFPIFVPVSSADCTVAIAPRYGDIKLIIGELTGDVEIHAVLCGVFPILVTDVRSGAAGFTDAIKLVLQYNP